MIDYDAFASLDVAEELSYASLDRITAPGDLVDRAMTMQDRATSGIQLPWSRLSGLFTLRPGELVLLGGMSGHGKSALANQLALHAVTQKKPNGEHYKAGICSLEMPAEYVFHQMSGIAGCVSDPHEHWLRRVGYYLNDKMFFYDKVDSMSPTECLQMAIGMRKFHGVDLLVIDGLMMIGLNDDLQEQKIFTQRLAEVAKAFDICIMLIAHLRKPSGPDSERKPPSKHDFLGSSNILNVASSALLVHQAKDKLYARNAGQEVDDSYGDTKLIVAKQRYAAYEGVSHLWFHDKCRALCNNNQRMYRPIDVGAEDGWRRKMEGKGCQSENDQSTKWSQEATPGGFGTSGTPVTTPQTASIKSSTECHLLPS
jgi:twinkle protein